MDMPKFVVVMKKSLEDFFSIKNTIFYTCIMLIVPLFFSLITRANDTFKIDSMTLDMQAVFISNIFIVMSFIWLAGLPLVLFSIIKCAPFISGEDSKGTLLVLVSKPLKRYEIILGKMLAFMIYIAVMQAALLFVTAYIWTLIYGLDAYVFSRLLASIVPIYFYSIFVGFLFGTISTALSAITKSTVKIITILVLMAIIIFFGGAMIRSFTVPTGIYVNSHLYLYDVNYHLGNTFDIFVGGQNAKIIPTMQLVLGSLSGIYDSSVSGASDIDQGIMYSSLKYNHYVPAALSFFLWIVFALILILTGIILFERRAIY
jgi:ABC-2 type transport system permease protein